MSARVHLLNPSHVSFGVAVITPRWLYVLAAATGTEWGDPIIVDESLDPEWERAWSNEIEQRMADVTAC